MKKLFFTIALSFISAAGNAAELMMTSIPTGLHQGNFSINCNYNIDNDRGDYEASGLVDNPGNYGLTGSISDVNSLINEELIPSGDKNSIFNLSIQLICANSASVTYKFQASQLIAPGTIFLNPPANCGS